MSSLINQQKLLPTGRKIGFAEYGDLSGNPAFILGDLPGSRIFGKHFELAAVKLRVRLIAVDPPGVGLSDPRPGYRLLDWVGDLVALADSLLISQFGVVGVSGGGPFAVACAYKIPQRITRAVVVNGLGPYSPAEKTPWWDDQTGADFELARLDPAQFRENWIQLFSMDVEDLLDAIIAQLPTVDRLVLTNPVVTGLIRDDIMEAFRFRDTKALGPRVQDIQGALDQAAAIWGDWGFNLQEICAPVSVLYGGLDLNVPPQAGAYQASHIPVCRPRFFPEDGHISLFVNRTEDILRELL